MKLTPYEEKVIEEIVRHAVEPNALARALRLAGKPLDKVLQVARDSKMKLFRKIHGTIEKSVDKAIRSMIATANKLTTPEKILAAYNASGYAVKHYDEIGEMSLERRDTVADRFDLSNATILGVEGVIMGVATTLCEGIPGAQLIVPSIVATDIYASLTFLSRHVCQIATCYGYDSRQPRTLPHILAAMTPQTDSSDEGFITSKATVVQAVREAGQYAGKIASGEIMEKNAPALVKLINYLAERLGIVVTEKELGMLVPIAGAALNGGINIAFQQVGHTTAKDYFRRIILEEKYGKEVVRALIANRINQAEKTVDR